MWNRVKDWRTSTVGLTGSASVLYLFNALGCRWPEPHEWTAVILPGLMGLLMRDVKKEGGK